MYCPGVGVKYGSPTAGEKSAQQSRKRSHFGTSQEPLGRPAFYKRFLSRLREVADCPERFSPQKREVLLNVVGELLSHRDCWVRVRAVQTVLALSAAELRMRGRSQ